MLAYAANEFVEDAHGLATFTQKLVVRRGNCDPVTVMSASGQFQDTLRTLFPEHPGLRDYGDLRIGSLSSISGRFQRLGVLAHGKGVVFEVASYPVLGSGLPSSADDGVYFVRTDGTGLRKLGPALGFGAIELVAGNFGGLGFTLAQTEKWQFSSSPDGRRICFTALVPDATGRTARQIVVLDVKSGKSTAVTHLPPTPSGSRSICCPFFQDNRTLIFSDGPNQSLATVPADGTGEPAPIPALQSVPGATVAPQFGVFSTGAGNAWSLAIEGTLERRYSPSDRLHEVFFLRGTRAIQLTNLHYPDTGLPATLGVDRVIFGASANPPPGTNPAGMCQLFSVPASGGRIRQITRFPDDGLDNQGCGAPTSFGASCRVNYLFQDLATRTVLFVSSCDPLGRNRYAEQVFTMRQDGTGLRQVTDFAGLEVSPDGSLRVELGGPYASSAAFR